MSGTHWLCVALKRSIDCRARTGSNFFISTTLPPVLFMCRPAALVSAKAVRRFSAMVSSKSCAVVKCAGLSRIDPARFTAPVMPGWV